VRVGPVGLVDVCVVARDLEEDAAGYVAHAFDVGVFSAVRPVMSRQLVMVSVMGFLP